METSQIKKTTEQFANHVATQRVSRYQDIKDRNKLILIVMKEKYPGLSYEEVIDKLFKNTMHRKFDVQDRQAYASAQNWVEYQTSFPGFDKQGFRGPEHLPIGNKKKHYKVTTLTESKRAATNITKLIEWDVLDAKNKHKSLEKKLNMWQEFGRGIDRYIKFVKNAGGNPDKITYGEAFKEAQKNNNGAQAVSI